MTHSDFEKRLYEDDPKMGRREFFKVLGVVAGVAALKGCAYTNMDNYAPLTPRQTDTGIRDQATQELEVNSQPPGADIYIGGRFCGKTPLRASLPYQTAMVNQVTELIPLYPPWGYNRSYQIHPVKQWQEFQPIPQQYEIIADFPGYRRQSQQVVVPRDSGAVFFLEKQTR